MADGTGHVTNTSTSIADPLLTFMFSVQGQFPDPKTPADKIDIDGYFTEITGPGTIL